MSAYEAVRIRLDPTPRQTRLLESHAGGARFAYNLMLAHVQRQISLGEKPDWTLYAMRRWWNEWKDEIAHDGLEDWNPLDDDLESDEPCDVYPLSNGWIVVAPKEWN